MLNNFEQIRERALLSGKKRNVLLWNGDDPGWLRVLDAYRNDGLGSVVVLGQKRKLQEAADEAQVDLSRFEVLEAISLPEAMPLIAARLHGNSIDVLIRGTVGVRDSLHALFGKDVGFRVGKKTISAISCHHVEALDRLVLVSDPVVIPTPDLNAKIELVNNAVAVARKLDDPLPKIALLCAVELVYTAMPHTLEAAAIAKMNERGQLKGCLVDGPLSMDVAVSPAAAAEKGVRNEVAGQAGVLIAPTLETAYGMYKAFVQFVKAPSGCGVVGGKIPYIVTSRQDSDQTKVNSLWLALV